MIEIRLIPEKEFNRVRAANIDKYAKLKIMADMCRANAIATVKRAGSGHLGSSFSSLDIVASLYFAEMNIAEVGVSHPDRDIYFSSKGHDAPGHYAVLYAMGLISEAQFINLRRHDGTHGHPDVSIAGIEANTGSLGMGDIQSQRHGLGQKSKGIRRSCHRNDRRWRTPGRADLGVVANRDPTESQQPHRYC